MAKDVVVCWMDGVSVDTTYPKIDRITEGAHALMLEVKKYPGVGGDATMRHIVSIPYHAMRWWKEIE